MPRAAGVEAGHGLVEDQHVGAHRHRAGDRGALLLAVAQHVRRALAQMADLERLERVLHAAARDVFGQPDVERPERDVLIDGAGEELIVGVLEDEADGGAQRGEAGAVVGHGLSAEKHGAGGRPIGAVEVQEQRRLAGAVGADDGQAPALAHLE